MIYAIRIATTLLAVIHVTAALDTLSTVMGTHAMVCWKKRANISCSVQEILLIIIDNNECISNATNTCEQVCINTPGSYTCQCNAGFRLSDDRRGCTGIREITSCYLDILILLVVVEVHECDEAIHACQHICTNTHGSYICSCYDGYNLASNGFSCNGITTSLIECCLSLSSFLLCQTLMSVHWIIIPVPITAITHLALTPVAVNQDTPWMPMDIPAMVIICSLSACTSVGINIVAMELYWLAIIYSPFL